jgi:hypothetical protein
MPSVAAVEASAAVLVREDKEPLSQMPPLILDVNEMREGDVIVQLDGEVDDTIEDVAKGAIHSPGRLDDSAKLGHVGSHPVSVEMGCATRHPDSRQRVRRQPPIDEGVVSGSPRDPTCSFARAAEQGPSAWNPTRRSWVEGTMKTSVTSAGLIPRSLSKKELRSSLERLGGAARKSMRTACP